MGWRDKSERDEAEPVPTDESEDAPAHDDQGIGHRRVELLFERSDVEGLRQQAKVGDNFASALLAVLLAEFDDVDGLRQRAGEGDRSAAEHLCCAARRARDVEGLRQLADEGDDQAAYKLARQLPTSGPTLDHVGTERSLKPISAKMT